MALYRHSTNPLHEPYIHEISYQTDQQYNHFLSWEIQLQSHPLQQLCYTSSYGRLSPHPLAQLSFHISSTQTPLICHPIIWHIQQSLKILAPSPLHLFLICYLSHKWVNLLSSLLQGAETNMNNIILLITEHHFHISHLPYNVCIPEAAVQTFLKD